MTITAHREYLPFWRVSGTHILYQWLATFLLKRILHCVLSQMEGSFWCQSPPVTSHCCIYYGI